MLPMSSSKGVTYYVSLFISQVSEIWLSLVRVSFSKMYITLCTYMDMLEHMLHCCDNYFNFSAYFADSSYKVKLKRKQQQTFAIKYKNK